MGTASPEEAKRFEKNFHNSIANRKIAAKEAAEKKKKDRECWNRIQNKQCYNCGEPNDNDKGKMFPCNACVATGLTKIFSERRRMAQRERSNNRDSPVMVRLLQEVIAKQ